MSHLCDWCGDDCDCGDDECCLMCSTCADSEPMDDPTTDEDDDDEPADADDEEE